MIGKIVVLTRAIMEWLVCSAHNSLPWFSGSKINQSETLLYHDSAHGILRVPQMPLILGQFGGWRGLLYICVFLRRRDLWSPFGKHFLPSSQRIHEAPLSLPPKPPQNLLKPSQTSQKHLPIHTSPTRPLIFILFLLIYSKEGEKQLLKYQRANWSDHHLPLPSFGITFKSHLCFLFWLCIFIQ